MVKSTMETTLGRITDMKPLSRSFCLRQQNPGVWNRYSRRACTQGLGVVPVIRVKAEVSSTEKRGRTAFWGYSSEVTGWTRHGRPAQVTASAANSHQLAWPPLARWKMPEACLAT